MNEPSLADRTFHIIMKRMVKTGQAPHFTEIAADLGVSMEEGRQALHALIGIGLGGWLFPGTDLIVSMAPFHNLPNQYRITIDGQQKWFAQGAFESPAVCWLFPGKTIHLEAPCLDCGEPIRVDFKDGEVLNSDPEGLIGHVSVPLRNWQENVTFTGSTMHFFRSEEHLRNWAGFDAEKEGGIISLSDLVKLTSIDHFRKRLEPDYISRYLGVGEVMKRLHEIGKTNPYWLP